MKIKRLLLNSRNIIKYNHIKYNDIKNSEINYWYELVGKYIPKENKIILDKKIKKIDYYNNLE